jgi:hypothetical protein
MICPYCGVSHRIIDVALRCKGYIDNEWLHYVILCSGLPGGTTAENLKRYSFFNLDNFNKTKEMKLQMEEYLIGLERKI